MRFSSRYANNWLKLQGAPGGIAGVGGAELQSAYGLLPFRSPHPLPHFCP
jgi:hypothetical protein